MSTQRFRRRPDHQTVCFINIRDRPSFPNSTSNRSKLEHRRILKGKPASFVCQLSITLHLSLPHSQDGIWCNGVEEIPYLIDRRSTSKRSEKLYNSFLPGFHHQCSSMLLTSTGPSQTHRNLSVIQRLGVTRCYHL